MSSVSISAKKSSLRSRLCVSRHTDSLASVIKKHINASEAFVFPSRFKKNSCMRALFWTSVFHIVGFTSRIDFCTEVKGFLKPYAKSNASDIGIGFSLNERITGSFYALIKLKFFFIYTALTLQEESSNDLLLFVDNTARMFRIRGTDRKYLGWLSRTAGNDKREKFMDFIVTKYSRFDQDDVSPNTVNLVAGKFAFFYDRIIRYVRSEVRRRMSFIPIFNVGVTRSDLENDLVTRVLRSYYKMHPTKLSDTDIQKYLFSSVKTNVVNIIEFYTTQKRSDSITNKNVKGEFLPATHRLLSDQGHKDGQSVEMSNGAYDRAALGLAGTIGTCDHLTGQEYANLEIDGLIRRYRGKNSQCLTVIMVLGRRFHRPFSFWLRQHDMIQRGETCVDYITQVSFAQAKRDLAEFMKLTLAEVNRLLNTVKKEVAAENK